MSAPIARPSATAPRAADATAAPVTAHHRYALALLTMVYVVNFVDRQIINIVAEPIKRELGLRDWQLGLMTGLAFALFYTMLGLPIARIAERGNRAHVLGACLTVWSGFTIACGFARGFGGLIVGRMGVGLGEAGSTPAAHSLIADYFPREKRARALATYALGSPIGGLIGLLFGGLIAGAYGWRAAFMIAGVPGLILAPIVLLTLREPRRSIASAPDRRPPAGFGETLRVLGGKRTFWLVCGASALSALFGLAHAAFVASFILRVHGDELSALAAAAGLAPVGLLGILLGLIAGFGGVCGSLIGGTLADRLGARDPRAYLLAPMIGELVLIPIYIAAVSLDSLVATLALLPLVAMLNSLYFGPVWATVQGIAPPNMRATASAIQLLTNNLIGLGAGPLLVGAMSDLFATALQLGPAEGLRLALIVLSLVGVPIAGLYWAARRTIARDFTA